MVNAEKQLRSDERSQVLDAVESALFSYFVGPKAFDEHSDDDIQRRVTVGMNNFMRLNKFMASQFGREWPSRA